MCGKRVQQVGKKEIGWGNIKPVKYQKRSSLQFQSLRDSKVSLSENTRIKQIKGRLYDARGLRSFSPEVF